MFVVWCLCAQFVEVVPERDNVIVKGIPAFPFPDWLVCRTVSTLSIGSSFCFSSVFF